MRMGIWDMAYISLIHYTGDLLAVSVTNKCRIECSHCGFSCTNKMNKKIDLEQVEKACKLFDQNRKLLWKPSLALYGGEPMEFPEHCKKIADLARKYRLNVILVTSGFWTMDPVLIDYVNNEIRPDYIAMSVNDNCNKKGVVDVNAVADYMNAWYKPKVLIVNWWVNEAINNKITKQLRNRLKKWYLTIGGHAYAVGRGRTDSNTIDPPQKCFSCGFLLREDGTLQINCMRGGEACRPFKYTHIDELDFHKFKEVIKKGIEIRGKRCCNEWETDYGVLKWTY